MDYSIGGFIFPFRETTEFFRQQDSQQAANTSVTRSVTRTQAFGLRLWACFFCTSKLQDSTRKYPSKLTRAQTAIVRFFGSSSRGSRKHTSKQQQ